MLRFFRQIRKKLVTKDTLNSYALYAIGEILLVVVGILIALQVNNWNEERTMIQLKDQILQDIISDLQADTSQITVLRRNMELRDGNSEYLLGFLTGKFENAEEARLVKAFLEANNLVGFTAITTSYNLLVERGAFNHIKSRTLKEALIDYYEFDTFEKEVQSQKFAYTSNYGKARFDHMPSGLLRENLQNRLNVYPTGNDVTKTTSINWELVKKDKNYMKSLNQVQAMVIAYMYDFNRYNLAQAELFSLIEEELN